MIGRDEVRVGARFVYTAGFAYTGPQGRGFQTFRLLVEVDKVDEHSCRWETVRVLSETGRPRDGAREAPASGGFALSGIDALVGAELLERVEEEA